MIDRKERFMLSKCDRCGKATKAKQNGVGDLYVLEHEYGPPLADQGDFCLKCIEKYDKENWLNWFKANRPKTLQ